MPELAFTSDWFSPHIPFWKHIFTKMSWDSKTPKTIVEIGSYEGRSTIWSVKNLLHHPESRIICVDTFEGSVEHTAADKHLLFDRFTADIFVSGCQSWVRVSRGESTRQLSRLISDGVQADFVYVDGSHQAPDVLTDAILAFNVVKQNGLIIFDDYTWSIEPHGREDVINSPKIAIDLFANIFRRKILMIGQSSLQIAFVKA